MLVPPRSIHLHYHIVHWLLHHPLKVSPTSWIKNSQSFVAGVGLSLRENHFPSNSLTWREMLIGLTTCLFNHGLATHFFNQFQLNSCKVRTTTTGQYNSGKHKATSHTHSRNYVATTTKNYDTHTTQTYTGCSGFMEDAAHSMSSH